MKKLILIILTLSTILISLHCYYEDKSDLQRPLLNDNGKKLNINEASYIHNAMLPVMNKAFQDVLNEIDLQSSIINYYENFTRSGVIACKEQSIEISYYINYDKSSNVINNFWIGLNFENFIINKKDYNRYCTINGTVSIDMAGHLDCKPFLTERVGVDINIAGYKDAHLIGDYTFTIERNADQFCIRDNMQGSFAGQPIKRLLIYICWGDKPL